MSGADRIARALNNWASEGLDTVGGADGEALDRLLSEYFCGEDAEDGNDQIAGCKQKDNRQDVQ